MDYILTGIVLLILLVVVLKGITIDENAEWMSVSYTTALKAIACIVVVFVHIPLEYGNKLQDMVGSFAYIGVIIFTMISAYGCRAGIDKNENYLDFFWKNRLLNLFIPILVFNLFSIPFRSIFFERLEFEVNNYVKVLIFIYFVFWCVWKVTYISRKYKDYVVAIIVIACSMITYFTEFDIFNIWPVEMLGFVIGLYLYNKKDKILHYMKLNNKIIFIISLFLSAGLGLAYIECKEIYFYGAYLTRIMLAIVILSFLFSITFNVSIQQKCLLMKLGKISYEVFLSHTFIIICLKNISPNLSSGDFICVVIIISIIFATIIKKISDKLMKIILKNIGVK